MLVAPDLALIDYVNHDLLEEPTKPIENLWGLPEPKRLTSMQQEDDFWKLPGKTIHPETSANYTLLETYRYLRILIETYWLPPTPDHMSSGGLPFSNQKQEGDARGVLGNQYALLSHRNPGIADQGWFHRRFTYQSRYEMAAINAAG